MNEVRFRFYALKLKDERLLRFVETIKPQLHHESACRGKGISEQHQSPSPYARMGLFRTSRLLCRRSSIGGHPYLCRNLGLDLSTALRSSLTQITMGFVPTVPFAVAALRGLCNWISLDTAWLTNSRLFFGCSLPAVFSAPLDAEFFCRTFHI